jgi:hypothetical protein
VIGRERGVGFRAGRKRQGTLNIARKYLARIFHGRIKIRIEAEPATSKRVKRNAVRLGCDPPLARMSF